MPAGFKVGVKAGEKDLVSTVWRLAGEPRSYRETGDGGTLNCEARNPNGPQEGWDEGNQSCLSEATVAARPPPT